MKELLDAGLKRLITNIQASKAAFANDGFTSFVTGVKLGIPEIYTGGIKCELDLVVTQILDTSGTVKVML